ncbi:Coenzyme A disulfide reductase [Lentilactobacillus hilgardii]|nr:pyridine nucleotide-disulfide oxidoreductase [Lentilactobacillus buchneri ATCC 11577]QIR10704.1 Coenzyme A disulfide reductase [Lentilactobacillus hilgardii]
MRVVIVGGVAGGMSAATRLRRLSEDTEIIVLDKGPYVSFANCALPYYMSGEISQRSSLIVESPDHLKERFNIDVRPNTEVVKINPGRHQVTAVHDGQSETLDYDRLILSPGSKAIVPDIVGLKEADNVFTLRSIPDVDKIMAELGQGLKTAAVIGAGSVGVEAIENLTKRGLKTTLVEAGDHILPFMDNEMAAIVSRETTEHSVALKLNTKVSKIADHRLELDDGSTLQADIIIVAAGVKPDTKLVSEAGIKTGKHGGILVDGRYQTSADDVYAVWGCDSHQTAINR